MTSYTCIHTYIHTYVRTYVRTYVHTCIHTYIVHTSIHTYIHAFLFSHLPPFQNCCQNWVFGGYSEYFNKDHDTFRCPSSPQQRHSSRTLKLGTKSGARKEESWPVKETGEQIYEVYLNMSLYILFNIIIYIYELFSCHECMPSLIFVFLQCQQEWIWLAHLGASITLQFKLASWKLVDTWKLT